MGATVNSKKWIFKYSQKLLHRSPKDSSRALSNIKTSEFLKHNNYKNCFGCNKEEGQPSGFD